MILEPFPYQHDGAAWLAAHPQAFLADEMGLGKSCQAIRASDLVGAWDILVICPAVARVNWEREFEKFSPMDRPCTILWKAKDPVPAGGVVIVSYDLATANAHLLKARRWDAMVIDEAHFLKERTAQRTKAIYGRSSRFPGIIASAARVWRLSGTPAPNWADELYTHAHSMGLTRPDESYYDWTFRYCKGWDGDYGYNITGHRNTEELKQRLAPVMLRRKKEEVMSQLPPLTWGDYVVEPSDVEVEPEFTEALLSFGFGQQALRKLYGSIEDNDKLLRKALHNVAWASHGQGPNVGRLAVLESMASSMTTLRRYILAAKLPKALEVIKADLESGAMDKVIIFAHFKLAIEGARKALDKFHPMTIYGATTPAKRQHAIDRFQTDPSCRVIICNIQAAGTAINLTAAHHVDFLEQDWVPANNAQAVMRAHRIGQTKPVTVRVFKLRGSVDEQVQQALLLKSRELSKIF